MVSLPLYFVLTDGIARTRTELMQSPGHVCYPNRADGVGSYVGCNFRTYPEMFYSGALTAAQTDAMYS